MREFVIETSNDGNGKFEGGTRTDVWTLESVLREINRDTTCTDPNGNTYLSDGTMAMAGSAMDTVDHDKEGCFIPYTTDDWQEGWECSDMDNWHRILFEIGGEQGG